MLTDFATDRVPRSDEVRPRDDAHHPQRRPSRRLQRLAVVTAIVALGLQVSVGWSMWGARQVRHETSAVRAQRDTAATDLANDQATLAQTSDQDASAAARTRQRHREVGPRRLTRSERCRPHFDRGRPCDCAGRIGPTHRGGELRRGRTRSTGGLFGGRETSSRGRADEPTGHVVALRHGDRILPRRGKWRVHLHR